MKKLLLIITIMVLHTGTHAQYQTSALRNLGSEARKNLVENILPFWINRMTDPKGGYYGRMDGNNKLYPDADRGGILNARILWTFSAAFMELKDSSYLQSATHARDYILDKFIDQEYGGAFLSVTSDGKPLDTRKQTYTQAFFIYGLSEYYLATGDKAALDGARKIYECIEKYCFNPVSNGYYEVYSRDWKRIHDHLIDEKTENDEKTMNTHLHLLEAYTNLYRAWPDRHLAGRLKNLIELFIHKIVDSNTGHLIVFMNDNWERTSALNSYGHDIEASWLLNESAKVLGDKKIEREAGHLAVKIVHAAEEGLQPDGSLIYEKDIASDHINTNRDWWPQAEAVTGFVKAYKLTGDQSYLTKALKCWEYIDKNMVDHVSGEWFNSISANGEVNKNADKAGFWKCPYHDSRMCLEMIEEAEDR
ncbi:MAG: AGE family epimerase/isomerase [Bacteroidales bacterium]|jgi:mannobiose 2-epimerase